MKNFNASNLETLLNLVGFRCDEYLWLDFSLGETFNEKFSYYRFTCKIENDVLKVNTKSYMADNEELVAIEVVIGDKTESEVLYEILSNEGILKSMSKVWNTDIDIVRLHKKLNIEFKNKQYLRFIGLAENTLDICNKFEKIAIYMQLNNKTHIVEVA